MARGIDQVQVVDLTIARLEAQCGGLRLDGDPALFLYIHRVEHLCFHLAIGETTATMNDAISQRRFAVVNVGDD